MKRRIRNILFITFVLLFIIFGGYLILVAQGFVVDFGKLKIEKTGAIFLKFTPRDAALFMDGEEVKYARAGLLESGVIVKNLAPGEYHLKLSKDGYNDWEKNLEVRPGLIVSASEIRLWPVSPSAETLVEEGVRGFELTKKGVVYENESGRILFGTSTARGDEIHLTRRDSTFVVTKERGDYFLTDLENPRSAVNLSGLFNSLKQRQLALSGIVPVTNVFFHPFSPGKLLLTSRTSLYVIDTEKVQIEKLVTLEEIKSAALGGNDVFLVGGNDNLVIANLLLKTTLQGAALGPASEFRVNAAGTDIFILTPEGVLKIYRRSSGKVENLALDVKEFALSPEEKRIAVITTGNKLEVVYIEEWKGDVKIEAGKVLDVPTDLGRNLKKLSWPDIPNYVFLLSADSLIVQEVDPRTPANSHFFAEQVAEYEIDGKNLYLLKTTGELSVSATAGGVGPF